jgi:hypothetical protein
MTRTRMGTIDPSGTYEVTASITSATAEDGSALDSAPQLPQGTDQFTTALLNAAQGSTPNPGNTATAQAGSASGGAGSGGIYPFAGGLPLHIPNIGLPTLPKALFWILIAAGAGFLFIEARK